MSDQIKPPERKATVLDRALRVFGDVRPGEGITAVLMGFNLFLLMCAYYIIKVVREPLIVADGAVELKAYAAGGQAILLLGFVPAYGYFVSRVDKMRLNIGVTLFFVACIQLFFVGNQIGVPYLGVLFYVWVGIFSLSTIAQFWGYANDFYSRPEGERLFPIVAIGATVGSTLGAAIGGYLFKVIKLDAFVILEVSAVMLLMNMALYWVISQQSRSAQSAAETDAQAAKAPAAKTSSANGFAMVLSSPYLRLIALMLILLNMVNTTGEFVLASMVKEAAIAATGVTEGPEIKQFIGGFYGEFFFYVNLASMTIQAVVVSRIMKVAGITGVLFALPVVAFGTYGLVAMGLGLGAVRWAKSAENATDYSVMNTAKALLWLPTTTEEKYSAKQAIDTFFVRSGDVLSALLVFVGTEYLAFTTTNFALANLVIIVMWAGVCWLVLLEYKRLSAAKELEPA